MALFLVFPAILLWSLWRIAVRRQRRSWPVVAGTVVRSQLVPAVASRTSGSPEQYLLTFRYRSQGTELETTESVQRSYIVRSKGFQRRLDSLHEGEEVPVYVAPDNPRNATVAPDGREAGRTFVLVFAGFGTLWVIVLALQHRLL